MKKAEWQQIVREDRAAAFLFDLTEKSPRGPDGRRTDVTLDIVGKTGWTVSDFEDLLFKPVAQNVHFNVHVYDGCKYYFNAYRTIFSCRTGTKLWCESPILHRSLRYSSVRGGRFKQRIRYYLENVRNVAFADVDSIYQISLGGRVPLLFKASSIDAAREVWKLMIKPLVVGLPGIEALFPLINRDITSLWSADGDDPSNERVWAFLEAYESSQAEKINQCARMNEQIDSLLADWDNLN